MKKEKFKLANKFLYFTGALALFLALPAVSFFRTVSVRNMERQSLGTDRKVASIGPVAQTSLANETLSSAPSILNEETENIQNAEESLGSNLQQSQSANLNSNRSDEKFTKGNIVQLDLACKSTENSIADGKTVHKGSMDSTFLQISGKNCLRKEASTTGSEIIITNTTNGFTATVFNKSSTGNEYQTDLIQLNEGENLIQVSYVANDGHKKSFSFSIQSETQSPTVR